MVRVRARRVSGLHEQRGLGVSSSGGRRDFETGAETRREKGRTESIELVASARLVGRLQLSRVPVPVFEERTDGSLAGTVPRNDLEHLISSSSSRTRCLVVLLAVVSSSSLPLLLLPLDEVCVVVDGRDADSDVLEDLLAVRDGGAESLEVGLEPKNVRALARRRPESVRARRPRALPRKDARDEHRVAHDREDPAEDPRQLSLQVFCGFVASGVGSFAICLQSFVVEDRTSEQET